MLLMMYTARSHRHTHTHTHTLQAINFSCPRGECVRGRYGPGGSSSAGSVGIRLCISSSWSSCPLTDEKSTRELARAAGSLGMAGGQAIDLDSVGKTLTQQALQQMHLLKTGALLAASVSLGASATEATGL